MKIKPPNKSVIVERGLAIMLVSEAERDLTYE